MQISWEKCGALGDRFPHRTRDARPRHSRHRALRSILAGFAAILFASIARGQGSDLLPDPIHYEQYVQWIRSLEQAPTASGWGAIDWKRIDAAYLRYLDAVEAIRFGADEQLLDPASSADLSNQAKWPRPIDAWTRLKGPDDLLLAETEQALPAGLRTQMPRLAGLVAITRSASGRKRTMVGWEFDAAAALASSLATLPNEPGLLAAQDVQPWREGVDALIQSLMEPMAAVREFEGTSPLGLRITNRRATVTPEERAVFDKALAHAHQIDRLLERRIAETAGNLSDDGGRLLNRLAWRIWTRTSGDSGSLRTLERLVARARVDDARCAPILERVEAYLASEAAFFRERSTRRTAHWIAQRIRFNAIGEEVAVAEQNRKEAMDHLLHFLNNQSRQEQEITQAIASELGVAGKLEDEANEDNAHPTALQAKVLALLRTPGQQPLPLLRRLQRLPTSEDSLESLPHPWCATPVANDTMLRLRRNAGSGANENAIIDAAIDRYQQAWVATVDPPLAKAKALHRDREHAVGREDHGTTVEREYAAIDEARRAANAADAALWRDLSAGLSTAKAEAAISLLRCERALGEPLATARRPVLPGKFPHDAAARFGNLVRAAEESELSPDDRATALAVLVARAGQLEAAGKAADEGELAALRVYDLAVFAAQHPSSTGAEADEEYAELLKKQDAASMQALHALRDISESRSKVHAGAVAALRGALSQEGAAAIQSALRRQLVPNLERGRDAVERRFERAAQGAADAATREHISELGDRWRGMWILASERIAEVGWPGPTSVPGGSHYGEFGWREHHRSDFLFWRRAQETAVALAELDRLTARP